LATNKTIDHQRTRISKPLVLTECKLPVYVHGILVYTPPFWLEELAVLQNVPRRQGTYVFEGFHLHYGAVTRCRVRCHVISRYFYWNYNMAEILKKNFCKNKYSEV